VNTSQKPRVALALGDPAGIGPELVAKLLARRDLVETAHVVLVGDAWLWEEGQAVAKMSVATHMIRGFEEVSREDGDGPLFLPTESVERSEIRRGETSAAGGTSVMKILRMCMDAATEGLVDGICFAPLNKHSMILAGMKFSDDLHFFADHLKVNSYCGELNTLGDLWTARVSSHVPFKDIGLYLTEERIKNAFKLLYDTLHAAGYEHPRVALAALNPHGGEGGSCGREEIDLIAPTVKSLNAEGYPATGPFPADTIFLKARDGYYDGIVTMYHDQGQIAMRLLGFERGVTIHGGLPIPITTAAHGSAYDIAGQNKASAEALIQAFRVACRLGATQRAKRKAAQQPGDGHGA
jgi:4-hydroxythreonine-4-phosphate dehydrogenase